MTDCPALPPDDALVGDLADAILACLCEQAAQAPNPPQHCCFRVGTQAIHDAGINADLCCEGLAYVALGDIYPSAASFPEQDIVRQASSSCAPPTWAVQFKLGIVRCIPVGNAFDPLPCTVWNTAARQNLIDARTLRRTACCARTFVSTNSGVYDGMSFVIERQSQSDPQGGCVERSMTLTVQIPNCDCN